MLLGNQAKKIAATMVSGGSDKEEFVQELGDESGEGRPSFEKDIPDASSDVSVGLDAATEKMMGALETGDKASFRAGLKSFIQMAALDEEPEELFEEEI